MVGAISVCVALPQPESILTSMPPVAEEVGGHNCPESESHHMGPDWTLGTMLLLGSFGSEGLALPPRAMMITSPKPLLMTTSGSVILQLLGLCGCLLPILP